MLRLGFTLFALSGVLALGCAESLAPSASETLRLGVDPAYKETGLAQALRAGFEQTSKRRLKLVFANASELEAGLRSAQLEGIMTSSSKWTEAMQTEGLLYDRTSIAHEELVFIGPGEDKFRAHGTTDPVAFMRNVIRSNHLYLVAAKNSFEAEGHGRLARKNGDRPGAGSEIQVNLTGVAFFKEAVRRKAFALVRRSALVLAASEGIKAHRVYQDGQADLVLPVDFMFLHKDKATRPGTEELRTYLNSEKTGELISRVGVGRVGLPFYGVGLPKSGRGATVPGSGTKSAP